MQDTTPIITITQGDLPYLWLAAFTALVAWGIWPFLRRLLSPEHLKGFGVDKLPRGVVAILGSIWLTLFIALTLGVFTTLVTLLWTAITRSTTGVEDYRLHLLTLAALTATLGAAVALPFTLLRNAQAARQTQATEQQTRNAEENLTTTLINKAVEGLGAEKTVKRDGKESTVPNIEVRIGAIYQLERIAHNQAHSGTDQGARDHIRIMEILCAYIRENAPASRAVGLGLEDWPDYPENPTAADLEKRAQWRRERAEILRTRIATLQANHKPRTDIQTALTVIGRRDAAQIAVERAAKGPGRDDTGYRLDLRATCLQAADLRELNLARALLTEARMEGANLSRALLTRSNFQRVRMEGANLSRACFEATNLGESWAEGTNLIEAQFANASLFRARMQGANSIGAKFEGASLRQACMEEAFLVGAKLIGTDLSGAQMGNANWRNVENSSNIARAADLRGIDGPDQVLLSRMVGNAATLLPETPEGEPNLYIPSCWAADPPGFEQLVAGYARYGFIEDDLRDRAHGHFCASGEVPRKTGTPWPVDAAPPWGAQGVDESDRDYRRRVEAWAAAQPPGDPID